MCFGCRFVDHFKHDTHLQGAQVWHVLTRDHSHMFNPQAAVSHTCLYLLAAEHHHTLAGTHFPSR